MGESIYSIGFIVILFVMMYFTMLRPSQKKEKETKKMLANLKPGDDIVTVGGIYGKIARIKEESNRVVILVGSERTKIEIARNAIASLDLPEEKKNKKKAEETKEEVSDKPNKKNIKRLGAKETPEEAPAEEKAE